LKFESSGRFRGAGQKFHEKIGGGVEVQNAFVLKQVEDDVIASKVSRKVVRL